MTTHIIESQQFTREVLEELFAKANGLRKRTSDSLRGNVLANLFYEPSTRTRLSFESAMLRMGGSVMGTENASVFSSVSKGESLEDTVRVVGNYADVIVIRHSEEGAAERASKVSSVPIINGGDGKGQHPTQALLDVYTLHREFGHVDNLKVGMVGDLRAGRTIRSLCYLLTKFDGIEITFASPENLRIKDDIKEYLKRKNVKFYETNHLEQVIHTTEAVYMTRIQRERISEEDYQQAKGKFVIDLTNFHLLKDSSRILHPLPHVEEIHLPSEIEDHDKKIAYFRQVKNGLYMRMALLKYALS